jgi:hypothetical protein
MDQYNQSFHINDGRLFSTPAFHHFFAHIS